MEIHKNKKGKVKIFSASSERKFISKNVVAKKSSRFVYILYELNTLNSKQNLFRLLPQSSCIIR